MMLFAFLSERFILRLVLAMSVEFCVYKVVARRNFIFFFPVEYFADIFNNDTVLVIQP